VLTFTLCCEPQTFILKPLAVTSLSPCKLAQMLTAGPTACFTAALGLGLQGKLSTTASFEGNTVQPLLLLLLVLLLLAEVPAIAMLLTVQVPSYTQMIWQQQEAYSSNWYSKTQQQGTGGSLVLCNAFSHGVWEKMY
jgi:hypothetical protein